MDSYAFRDPQTLAFGHAHARPSAATFTTTVSEGTLWPTTLPGPAGEVTEAPTGGASLRNSWYSGCSYFRQHISRPHAPAIRSGFTGSSWSLAIRTDTGSKSFRKVAQHRSRPHGPIPPCSRASSRGPICRSSTRARSRPPRSRTSARKSTRCGALKYTTNTFSEPMKSTAVIFIGSSCSLISLRAASRPSARRRQPADVLGHPLRRPHALGHLGPGVGGHQHLVADGRRVGPGVQVIEPPVPLEAHRHH